MAIKDCNVICYDVIMLNCATMHSFDFRETLIAVAFCVEQKTKLPIIVIKS